MLEEDLEIQPIDQARQDDFRSLSCARSWMHARALTSPAAVLPADDPRCARAGLAAADRPALASAHRAGRRAAPRETAAARSRSPRRCSPTLSTSHAPPNDDLQLPKDGPVSRIPLSLVSRTSAPPAGAASVEHASSSAAATAHDDASPKLDLVRRRSNKLLATDFQSALALPRLPLAACPHLPGRDPPSVRQSRSQLVPSLAHARAPALARTAF
jgi:hypothetical protein